MINTLFSNMGTSNRYLIMVGYGLFFILCVFNSNSANASQPITKSDQKKAIMEQERIFKKKEQEWGDAQQRRQIQANFKEKLERMSQEKVDIGDINESEDHMFEIKTITLNGVTKLSKPQQYFLTQKYIGQKMGVSRITQLLADIQNEYIRLGYTTTKPYPIADQDISSGHLIIAVDEGRIAKIVDEYGKRRLFFFTAFPFLEGSVLNIRDIEQGLDQMNRLQSNQVKVNLIPQKKDDGLGSIVQIVNHSQDKNSFYAAMKYSSNTTHPIQIYPYSFDISKDNLLKLNDTWYLTYSQDNGEHGQNSNSMSLSASVPFGSMLFSYNYSQFEYHMFIGENRNIITKGKTNHHGFGMTKTMLRTRTAKTNALINLNRKSKESVIEDVLNDPQTRVLTVLDVGLSQSFHEFLGMFWSFRVKYHWGLDIWGAKKDPRNLMDTEPQHQFGKVTVMNTIYKSFRVFKVPIFYNMMTQAQYSKDTLFSSQQLSLGGAYSIRGFSDTILGDMGVLCQNELSIPLHSIIFPKPLAAIVRRGGLTIFGGVDTGYARAQAGKKANGGRGEGAMTGMFFGLRHNSQYMAFDWTYAKPIRAPDFIRKTKKEHYWNVTIKLL